MAVIVKYVVERNGVEKMTFAAKSEADAYDKMLDIAEEIQQLLAASSLCPNEQQQDELAFFLAQHKDELLQALGAKAKTPKKEKSETDLQSTNENSRAVKPELKVAAESTSEQAA
jgi:dsDNA-binding SOS-regulon protein